MNQKLTTVHKKDKDGNPTGGFVRGVGIVIDWQDGPLGFPPDMDKHNGAFVEGIIQAAIDRLTFFQDSKFACRENALAITKLDEAMHWLAHRTANRTLRQVEGTHSA